MITDIKRKYIGGKAASHLLLASKEAKLPRPASPYLFLFAKKGAKTPASSPLRYLVAVEYHNSLGNSLRSAENIVFHKRIFGFGPRLTSCSIDAPKSGSGSDSRKCHKKEKVELGHNEAVQEIKKNEPPVNEEDENGDQESSL